MLGASFYLRGNMTLRILIATPSRGTFDHEHLACRDELYALARKESFDAQKEGREPAFIISHEFMWGCSLLDHARSILATDFYNTDNDVMVWLDDDMLFDAQEFVRLAQEAHERKAIVGAVASTKKPLGEITARFKKETEHAVFFEDGEVMPVDTIGTGLTAVSRDVLVRIIEAEEVQCVRVPGNRRIWAFFMTLVTDFEDDGAGCWWGEDTSFCLRARAAGCKVYADTRMRVGHKGSYVYQLEDTANATPLYKTVKMSLGWDVKEA